jgi:hypothetical protein
MGEEVRELIQARKRKMITTTLKEILSTFD